jgi:hypothetical protein
MPSCQVMAPSCMALPYSDGRGETAQREGLGLERPGHRRAHSRSLRRVPSVRSITRIPPSGSGGGILPGVAEGGPDHATANRPGTGAVSASS